MPFVTPTNKSTGTVITSGIWNQDIVDNTNSLFPDGATVDTWTPLIESDGTDPTTSSNVGRQYQIGGIMFFWGRYVISANGSGNWYTDLPVASTGLTSSGSAGAGSRVGSWHARDDSTGATAEGSLQLTVQLSTDAFFFVHNDGLVSGTVPWTWATGDVLTFSGHYPVA